MSCAQATYSRLFKYVNKPSFGSSLLLSRLIPCDTSLSNSEFLHVCDDCDCVMTREPRLKHQDIACRSCWTDFALVVQWLEHQEYIWGPGRGLGSNPISVEHELITEVTISHVPIFKLHTSKTKPRFETGAIEVETRFQA